MPIEHVVAFFGQAIGANLFFKMFCKKTDTAVLPSRMARRRALTLPLDEPNRTLISKLKASYIMGMKANLRYNGSQTTCSQSQSILFRLPFEIRQMIWKEVLGGNLIHIMILSDGLAHVRCMYTQRHPPDLANTRPLSY